MMADGPLQAARMNRVKTVINDRNLRGFMGGWNKQNSTKLVENMMCVYDALEIKSLTFSTNASTLRMYGSTSSWAQSRKSS